jgi:hypothetical protein
MCSMDLHVRSTLLHARDMQRFFPVQTYKWIYNRHYCMQDGFWGRSSEILDRNSDRGRGSTMSRESENVDQ